MILKKIKTLKDLLWFVWQLPQNLLGLWLIKNMGAWYSVAWDDCYFFKRLNGVYSLGSYIILSEKYYNNVTVIKHAKEYQQLSRKTGWLYLFVLLFRKNKSCRNWR